MSCYNWERGTIKIPSKEWKGVRDRLVKTANERRARLLDKALLVWSVLNNRDNINAARKAVQSFNKTQKPANRVKLSKVTPRAVFQAINDPWDHGTIGKAIEPLKRGVLANAVLTGRRSEDEDERVHTIGLMLFPYIYEKDERGREVNTNKRKRLAKPKKSDPAVKPLVPTKVAFIKDDESSISFDHKAKTLTWSVSENNRAVERAHEGWLWKALTSALSRVKWTRGSGGKIVGNDEYNRDNSYEGGGGNYVTHEFGPKVARPYRDKYAAAYRKSGYYRSF